MPAKWSGICRNSGWVFFNYQKMCIFADTKASNHRDDNANMLSIYSV